MSAMTGNNRLPGIYADVDCSGDGHNWINEGVEIERNLMIAARLTGCSGNGGGLQSVTHDALSGISEEGLKLNTEKTKVIRTCNSDQSKWPRRH